MSVLVLTLPAAIDADTAAWALVEDGAILAEGAVRPGEAPALPGDVRPSHGVALMPAEAVFVRRVPVPGGSERDARRAAPFLIEEQIGQALETVSVEVGPKNDQGARFVMAVDTALRDSWRRFAAGLGVKPLYAAPDAMLTPGRGADLTVFEIDGRVLVQVPDGDLGAADSGDGAPPDRDVGVAIAEPLIAAFEADLANAILPAFAARLTLRRVLVSEEFDAGLVAPDAGPIALKRLAAPDLRLCAAVLDPSVFGALPPALGAGLTSGFDWAQTLRPWRVAAGLGVAVLIGMAALNAGQAALLEKRAQAYEQAKLETFTTAFPDTRPVNIEVQLRRRLASVGAAEAGGDFLTLASALSAILSDIKGVRVDSLRFDAERGGLAVSAVYADFGDFEALRAAAEARGLVLEDGGARQSADGVQGDFTVRTP